MGAGEVGGQGGAGGRLDVWLAEVWAGGGAWRICLVPWLRASLSSPSLGCCHSLLPQAEVARLANRIADLGGEVESLRDTVAHLGESLANALAAGSGDAEAQLKSETGAGGPPPMGRDGGARC